MTEKHLHYIWKNRLFDALRIGDEYVRVLKVGKHNICDGPDFEFARVSWQGIEWCGAVEIHLRASDWTKHKHDRDPRYDAVVLHVVQEADTEVYNTRGEALPTATMHISPTLLQRLEDMDITTSSLRCTPEVKEVPPVKIHNLLDRLSIERLESKIETLSRAVDDSSYHALFYHTLMRYLGAHANNDAMALVAHHLPYTYLKKHANDPTALEAMLLGQAALIADTPGDDYEALIKEEYLFYARKFALSPVPQGLFRKLRIRPYAYPARRLAIAAALMRQEGDVMTAISTLDFTRLETLLASSPSEYWCRHYDFGHKAPRTMGGVGESTVRSLLINAIVPTAYHYHTTQGNTAKALEAFEWLMSLPAEDNHIIRLFSKHGLSARHAADTQALIRLYNSYCTRGLCLSCPVAPEIFRSISLRQED